MTSIAVLNLKPFSQLTEINKRFGLLIELTSFKTKKRNADPLKYSAILLISDVYIKCIYGCCRVAQIPHKQLFSCMDRFSKETKLGISYCCSF